MAKPRTVMIADDDMAILDAIATMLQFEGYSVITVSDSTALLHLARYPDLLLLDVWMNGIDGRAICRQLKLQERFRKLPIIMISASKDIKESALDAGADAFFAKPFEMDELVEKIKQCIG